MYINECIRMAQNYLPSEYDEGEMCVWCNEVSAMLLAEDRTVYKEVTLPRASDGTVLLPDGVDIGDVAEVLVDVGGKRRRLRKRDLRTRLADRIVCACPVDSVEVIYAERFAPIRRVVVRGEISVDAEAAAVTLPACALEPGDTISLTIYSASGTVTQTLSPIPVLALKSAGTETIMIIVSKASLGTLDGAYEDAQAERAITEQTLCGAPYDRMYVDYLLAKICLYQRDTDGYNRHISSFNTLLEAYRVWLVKHMPQQEGHLFGWW